MNVSGDIVWDSHYYKQLTSGLTTTENNFIADYVRKRIYISNTVNNTEDTRILIQLFDFNMNKLGEWESSMGIYIPLRLLRFTLNEDGSRILMASATGPPFAPMPGYLEINFSDFSNSVLVSASFNLGLLYGNSGEGAHILGENKGKMYIARDGGGAFFAQRKIQFQSVDYPSFSSSDGIIYDTGINGAIRPTYRFNKYKNELETLVVLSDETTVEFWTFNFDTLTLMRSSNNLQNYSDGRSGDVYLLSTGNILRIAWWDINDNSVKVGYFDRNMNLISIEGKMFTNAQRPGTAAGRYNVIVPLDTKGNQLSFFHYQQNYWRTLPQQSTKSLPLFSGDSNGTIQTTKDKPLMDNRPHIVEIDTSLAGVTTNTQFQTTGMLGDYSVYYDNGSGVNGWFYNLTDEQTLTFPQQDVYELHFYGKDNFQGFQFLSTGDKDKLLRITQWGNVDYSSRNSNFSGCSNLTEVVTKDSMGIASFNGIFRYCSSLHTFDVPEVVITTGGAFTQFPFGGAQVVNFNAKGIKHILTTQLIRSTFGDGLKPELLDLSHIRTEFTNLGACFNNFGGNIINISGWKTKNVNNFGSMFFNTPNLTKIIGLGYLNTENVTNMFRMFYDGGPIEFENLSRWNTSNVINMGDMFLRAGVIQGSIGIGNWDVSNVTNMRRMLYATRFDCDLSNWDVSSVTIMEEMFYSRGKDVGDISNWNISNVNDMTLFAPHGAVSNSTYTQCLLKWSQLPLQQGVQLNMGGTKYDASAQTAKDYIINTFGWTISDGGQL